MKFDYAGLIGIPYVRGGWDPETGLDCRTLAFLVAHRLGFQGIPAPHQAEEACLQWVVMGEAPWELLGCAVCDARKLGDVILTGSPGAAAGVLILVDEGERIFLTASLQRGRVVAMHSRIVERVESVIGAYRWVGT